MAILIHQRYEVLDLLGSGSIAQTYLVKNVRQPEQENAVLKLLKPAKADKSFRLLAQRLFDQEVQTLKALGHHSCIPTLLAEFCEMGEQGLVQSKIEGVSVQDSFKRGAIWSEGELVSFLEQSLGALAVLHDAGFLHCDLTPAHWIQSFSGPLVLIDFNGARKISPSRIDSLHLGAPNSVTPLLVTPTSEADLLNAFMIGAADYMAPEQRQGTASIPSDLYALGLIALQGVTGRSPNQLNRNAQGEICWQPLKPIRVELIDILTHLVRFHPQDRYATTDEVLTDVRNARPCWSRYLTKWWELNPSLPNPRILKH